MRFDRKAISISLLVVPGVRADGQKVRLAIKSMGGESAEAWRTVLDDLIKRGLKRPAFLIVDGAPGLDKAVAAVWDGVPVQRCARFASLETCSSMPPERPTNSGRQRIKDLVQLIWLRQQRAAPFRRPWRDFRPPARG